MQVHLSHFVCLLHLVVLALPQLYMPILCCSKLGKVSTPKKQHLMIFMRALLTTIIGQCQVKALNTKLAIVVSTRV